MSAQDRAGEEELALVEAKYAGERRDRQVALARDAFEFWLADRRQRGARRLAAADGYLRSAGHTGLVSAGIHAAAALVWPGSIRHVNAHRAARVDPQWAAEAERWLGPLRTGGGPVLVP
jgi:hypothetical protein